MDIALRLNQFEAIWFLMDQSRNPCFNGHSLAALITQMDGGAQGVSRNPCFNGYSLAAKLPLIQPTSKQIGVVILVLMDIALQRK